MEIVKIHVSDVPHVIAQSNNYPVQVTFELTAATAPRNKVLHFGTRVLTTF